MRSIHEPPFRQGCDQQSFTFSEQILPAGVYSILQDKTKHFKYVSTTDVTVSLPVQQLFQRSPTCDSYLQPEQQSEHMQYKFLLIVLESHQ